MRYISGSIFSRALASCLTLFSFSFSLAGYATDYPVIIAQGVSKLENGYWYRSGRESQLGSNVGLRMMGAQE